MPNEAWGSYEQVYAWIKMEDSERRRILEEHELIFTEEEETWKTLKGEPTVFYT